ncbi:hypothetical protein ACLOJK_005589 [Asimina triloba]
MIPKSTARGSTRRGTGRDRNPVQGRGHPMLHDGDEIPRRIDTLIDPRDYGCFVSQSKVDMTVEVYAEEGRLTYL